MYLSKVVDIIVGINGFQYKLSQRARMQEQMLDLKFMQKMSFKTRKAYVDHIFEKGKDVFGRPFKAYSAGYGEKKRANKFKSMPNNMLEYFLPLLTLCMIQSGTPGPNNIMLTEMH